MPSAVRLVILMVSPSMGVAGAMSATQSWKGWPHRNFGFFAWWFSPAWLKSVPLKEKDEAMGLTSVLDIEGLQLQLGKWDG